MWALERGKSCSPTSFPSGEWLNMWRSSLVEHSFTQALGSLPSFPYLCRPLQHLTSEQIHQKICGLDIPSWLVKYREHWKRNPLQGEASLENLCGAGIRGAGMWREEVEASAWERMLIWHRRCHCSPVRWLCTEMAWRQSGSPATSIGRRIHLSGHVGVGVHDWCGPDTYDLCRNT